MVADSGGRINLKAALDVVYGAIESVNGIRRPEHAIARTPEVVLVGEDGCLDSLGLVTLLLAIESRVLQETGEEMSLLGDEEFESLQGAFRTPLALAELIVQKLAS